MDLLFLGRRFQRLSVEDKYNQVQLMTMSAVDFLDRWFETDVLKATMSASGIIGTFLGVPVAALIAVVYRYVRDELDGRTPEVADDGTRVQVTGDETGATVVRERVPTPAPGPVPDDAPDGDDDTPARPPA
jgi:hypothetical protein